MDEFNPEQRLMVEIMRTAGQPNPEDVVRADPVTAAFFGATMMPAVKKLAEAAAEACASIAVFQEQTRKARDERRRRVAGWIFVLVTAAIMWVLIIAALRWAV